MPKYVLAYHGGATPETEPEVAKVMAAWEAWMGSLGEALVDPGNPIGQTKTLGADGSVTVGGGTDPLTGYSLLNASDIDEAVALAKGCPIFESGGSIEIAETIEM